MRFIVVITLSLILTGCLGEKVADRGTASDFRGDTNRSSAALEGKFAEQKEEEEKSGSQNSSDIPKDKDQIKVSSSEVSMEKDTMGQTCKSNADVTQSEVEEWAREAAEANPGKKIIYLDADLLQNDDEANLARVGLFKALNHTAIKPKDVHIGEDVSDGHGAVYAIDPDELWPGKGERSWQTIAAGRGSTTGAPPAFRQAEQPFAANEPVSADRAAYNAVSPSVYLTLIEAPFLEAQLRGKISAGQPVAYSAIKNAIVFGARIIYIRKLPDGSNYWVSCDRFIGAREGQEIPYSTDRLPRHQGVKCDAFAVQAHEAWHDMPNGFPAYYIWGNGTQLRGKAEREFVVDPGNPVNAADVQNLHGGDLITGRSCITCHIQGVQRIKNDYDGQGEWASQSELNKYYNESRTKFKAAMTTIVDGVVCNADPKWARDVAAGFHKVEPVASMIKRIEGDGSDIRGNLIPLPGIGGLGGIGGLEQFAPLLD